MNTIVTLCVIYTGYRFVRRIFKLVKEIRNTESPWIDIGRPGSGAAGGH